MLTILQKVFYIIYTLLVNNFVYYVNFVNCHNTEITGQS